MPSKAMLPTTSIDIGNKIPVFPAILRGKQILLNLFEKNFFLKKKILFLQPLPRDTPR
jgi:hypothetical protein